MSGSLFAPWSRVREPLNYAVQLGRQFNCSIPTDLTNDHGKIVDCLRNISAARLMAAKLNVPSFHLDFGPSFDGVTIKNNFADIKGKRSFGSRYLPFVSLLYSRRPLDPVLHCCCVIITKRRSRPPSPDLLRRASPRDQLFCSAWT